MSKELNKASLEDQAVVCPGVTRIQVSDLADGGHWQDIEDVGDK
jgi:hypothetical protein